MIKDLIFQSRSFRRYHQDHEIDLDTMHELLDLARIAPSGGNLQPLKYVVSCTPEKNTIVFPNLVWAGYLKDWPGPEEGERPSAYFVILCDTEVSKSTGVDHGIAAQNILLGAAEKGLGGCMIGAIKRKTLREALNISEQYEIVLVVALGKPKETVVLDEAVPGGSIEYWRDNDGVHHVPKRRLDDILVG